MLINAQKENYKINKAYNKHNYYEKRVDSITNFIGEAIDEVDRLMEESKVIEPLIGKVVPLDSIKNLVPGQTVVRKSIWGQKGFFVGKVIGTRSDGSVEMGFPKFSMAASEIADSEKGIFVVQK